MNDAILWDYEHDFTGHSSAHSLTDTLNGMAALASLILGLPIQFVSAIGFLGLRPLPWDAVLTFVALLTAQLWFVVRAVKAYRRPCKFRLWLTREALHILDERPRVWSRLPVYRSVPLNSIAKIEIEHYLGSPDALDLVVLSQNGSASSQRVLAGYLPGWVTGNGPSMFETVGNDLIAALRRVKPSLELVHTEALDF